MRTALVTGAASGFGFHLTERLVQLGWTVFATDVEPGGLERLTDSPLLLKRRMDVRDPSDVATVCAEASARGIDLLVNDAGYAVFGTQEEADLDAIRALFEVNVIGLARVTQALLPGLRARSGMIVNLSSVAGQTVFPESGFYAGTKHAVEAMSEALAQEAGRFGVRVRLVEPGSFQTGFQARAMRHSQPRSPDSPYAAQHPIWDRRRSEVLLPDGHPSQVAEAIVRSLDDPAPFLRVPVGEDAERILALRADLPRDSWTRLAMARGGITTPTLPGDVQTPEEVAGGTCNSATRSAFRNGHLSHWTESEAGQAALEWLKNTG